MIEIKDNGWRKLLKTEFTKPYYVKLINLINNEYKQKSIFPPKSQIFNAFENCSPTDIKVVIIGQDPYHGAGQACGLSFSVSEDVKQPPSLKNIFKEIYSNSSSNMPISGDLTSWTEQGVLLLNAILTVEEGKAASHRKIGWETFTDKVIKKISANTNGVIFMLWGKFAQSKARFVDKSKHHILETVHPSPLSAYRGFLGCGHFEEANKILNKQDKTPIVWEI